MFRFGWSTERQGWFAHGGLVHGTDQTKCTSDPALGQAEGGCPLNPQSVSTPENKTDSNKRERTRGLSAGQRAYIISGDVT